MGFHNDEPSNIHRYISSERGFVVRFPAFFRPSLSLSLLPGAFTPCKNESNNYRALCLTRNFHPCRSSYIRSFPRRSRFYERQKNLKYPWNYTCRRRFFPQPRLSLSLSRDVVSFNQRDRYVTSTNILSLEFSTTRLSIELWYTCTYVEKNDTKTTRK